MKLLFIGLVLQQFSFFPLELQSLRFPSIVIAFGLRKGSWLWELEASCLHACSRAQYFKLWADVFSSPVVWERLWHIQATQPQCLYYLWCSHMLATHLHTFHTLAQKHTEGAVLKVFYHILIELTLAVGALLSLRFSSDSNEKAKLWKKRDFFVK